jgi:hypothetical protein
MERVMTDAPEKMYVRGKPNGALGRWHDATSLQETAEIASGGPNPMSCYIREDIHADALEREAKLREALEKARDQGRDPDYCYDEEWGCTMAWTEWPDLMDGHDPTEPTPLYTLYKGPTKWVVLVPTGEDDSEVRLFASEEEARAALGVQP